MDSFPRVRNRAPFVSFLIAALGFIFIGINDLVLNTSYDNVPSVILPFVILFVCAWIGFAVYAAFYGLSGLQTIKIDREEIRICLGPLVIKKIPTERIKSVSVSHMFDKTRPVFFLVLSKYTAEELNPKGEKLLKRKQFTSFMFQSGIPAEGRYAGAKAYLFKNTLHSILWIEDTDEVRAILRKYLHGTVFLCK